MSCSNLKIEAGVPVIFVVILLFLLSLGKIKVSLASHKSFRFAYFWGEFAHKITKCMLRNWSITFKYRDGVFYPTIIETYKFSIYRLVCFKMCLILSQKPIDIK